MRICAVVALASLALGALPTAARAALPHNVLILRGEAADLPGGIILVESVETSIRSALPDGVDFYVETIDTGRFGSGGYEQRLRDLFAEAYAGVRLDLVVALGQPAVQFMVRERGTLFPGVPALYGFVESRMLKASAAGENTSIGYVRLDAAGTARMALRAFPATRQVVVIGGGSRFDQGWQQLTRLDLGSGVTVPVVYDYGSPLDDLLKRVARLPADSVILFTSMTRDGANRPMRPVTAVEELRRAATVPIFGISSTYIGRGIVGGSVIDVERHGADLGRQAVKMLAGERPPPFTTLAIPMADWREVQRFRTPESQFQANTLFAFREPSLWQQQKGSIITALAVMGAQLALIVALVRSARRRRQGQEMLTSSDRLKGAILDSLPAHVAVLNRDGVIIAVNDAWSEFGHTRGLSSDRMVGPGADYLQVCRDAAQAGSEGAAEAVSLIAQACRGERPPGPLEYVCESPHDDRWFLMTAEPLRRPEGGAVVTHSDITGRKHDELALRESEARFRRLADGLPVAIWMSDIEGGFSYVNKEWQRMTGSTLEAASGEGWLASVHAADREMCRDVRLRALQLRTASRVEYRIRQFDGAYRWVIDSGVPRYGADGTFHGYVGGCVDITDRKENERMLRGLSHRLMQAQDEERRRIARELHDHLSQQLALLAIDLQQLSIEPPGSADGFVAAAQDAWRRTTEIASDVHAISHRLHPSKMEALGLVATMKAHCRDISRQSLTVRFEHEGAPPVIAAERAVSLFRVLEEALSNVVRHSRATEARVSLTGTADGGVALTISDNGQGFASNRSTDGLGLISMRERVQALDGTISFTSPPGRGSVVSVRVPAASLPVSPVSVPAGFV